jgi:enterobacteria phage integrase
MNSADLAGALELMARALRHMPEGVAAAAPIVAASPEQHRTLSDWLDVHQRILRERGYKPQTLKNRTANLAHVRRLWGQRPVAALKPHEVATGLKTFPPERSSTAVRVLAELRDSYAEAVANGWAETNPAAHIKPPRHKVKRARLKWETWQAMRTLAHTSPQRWVESLLLLALVTGQRRADLAKVRFNDVVDGHLRIEQQKQAGKGFGARVEIPLSLRLDAIGMTVGDVVEHCRGSAKPGPTLLRKAGGGEIEQSSLSARFHDHIVAVLGAKAHGQHEWPSLHEVRSLSARLYHTQGVDVQTLLGHKHAEMTEVYRDDRGLSRDQWKRVAAASLPAG